MVLFIFLLLSFLSTMCCFVYFWSLYWPKSKIIVVHKASEKVIVNGRCFYKPAVDYCYYANSKKYYSSSVSLLGMRSFESKEDVEVLLNALESIKYCPLWPDKSYLFRENRVLYGLFSVNVVLYPIVCFLL